MNKKMGRKASAKSKKIGKSSPRYMTSKIQTKARG